MATFIPVSSWITSDTPTLPVLKTSSLGQCCVVNCRSPRGLLVTQTLSISWVTCPILPSLYWLLLSSQKPSPSFNNLMKSTPSRHFGLSLCSLPSSSPYLSRHGLAMEAVLSRYWMLHHSHFTPLGDTIAAVLHIPTANQLLCSVKG